MGSLGDGGKQKLQDFRLTKDGMQQERRKVGFSICFFFISMQGKNGKIPNFFGLFCG